MRSKIHVVPAVPDAGVAARGRKRGPRALRQPQRAGRRVITEEEMARRECPLPPEPEWAAEWEDAPAEHAKP